MVYVGRNKRSALRRLVRRNRAIAPYAVIVCLALCSGAALAQSGPQPQSIDRLVAAALGEKDLALIALGAARDALAARVAELEGQLKAAIEERERLAAQLRESENRQ